MVRTKIFEAELSFRNPQCDWSMIQNNVGMWGLWRSKPHAHLQGPGIAFDGLQKVDSSVDVETKNEAWNWALDPRKEEARLRQLTSENH